MKWELPNLTHGGGCVSTAEALASMVTKEDLAKKQLYPSLPQIRDISAKVATAVAEVAYEQGKHGLIFTHILFSLSQKPELSLLKESGKINHERLASGEKMTGRVKIILECLNLELHRVLVSLILGHDSEYHIKF